LQVCSWQFRALFRRHLCGAGWLRSHLKNLGIAALAVDGKCARTLEFCYDTTAPGYAVVGAKGIHMCDEWRLSLRKFLEDMAPSYVEGKSLLRTDATKDYRKENCYWGDSNPGSSIKHSVKALGYDAVIWAKVRAVYHSFHNQCYDPARKGYPSWGGRGIKFCDEWKESSRQFILDMIDGYTDGATIELIDDCAPMSADS
jgi:hypothetical protein